MKDRVVSSDDFADALMDLLVETTNEVIAEFEDELEDSEAEDGPEPS